MAMVRSINRVLLVGRVGSIYLPRKDLPNGKPGPLNISIATQEIYRENKQRSDWHKVTFWGGPADFAEKYLAVGALVAIEGALRTVQNRNADGSLSSYVNIEGHQLILLVDSPRGKGAKEADFEEAAGDAEPEDASGQEKLPEDDIPSTFKSTLTSGPSSRTMARTRRRDPDKEGVVLDAGPHARIPAYPDHGSEAGGRAERGEGMKGKGGAPMKKPRGRGFS